MQVAIYQEVKGQGFLALADLTRPAESIRGKIIYNEKCEACHQPDGGGIWNPETEKYVYPAIFGPDSFNDDAGMYRLRTGVGFVYCNMPYGRADAATAGALNDTSSLLSPEDTWSVMAYVISQDRPIFSKRESDWVLNPGPDGVPDWIRKNLDADYPHYYPRVNYADNICAPPDLISPLLFPQALHKYGLWTSMIAVQNKMVADYKALCLPK